MLEEQLKKAVVFLKDKPEYEDEGMVSLVINCTGELVLCKIDNKTRNPELDAQIVGVFANMKTWIPGSINKKSVDTI